MIKSDFRKRLMRLLASALVVVFLPACALCDEADPAILAALERLGYLSGSVTDVTAAIGNFQVANGQERTGDLNLDTLALLESPIALSLENYLASLSSVYNGAVVDASAAYEEIARLQTALSALGYYEWTSDGVYGPGTTAAVSAFQIANGLTPTGTADGATLYRLYEGRPIDCETFLAAQIARKGDSGRHVRSLQRRLLSLGFFDGECTAAYGERTELAVMAFQRYNDLPDTGVADLDTCRLLFSGRALSPVSDSILTLGDSGKAVSDLQTALQALEYFSGEPDGVFTEKLFVSVVFFQLANGLAPSGQADNDLLSLAQSGQAISYANAEEAFERTLYGADTDTRNAALLAAQACVGKTFPAAEDTLFPGFSFAQYVCAASGMAIASPGRLFAADMHTLAENEPLVPGTLIGLELTENNAVSILFGIAADEDSLIFSTSENDWVVSADISQMEYGQAYVWMFE